MKRMWMVAALPLLLMVAMFFSLWVLPWWANVLSLEACLLILASALLTGLCVLLVVFIGWMRGAYQLKRGDILVATMLASLDVLIPTTLAGLIWFALYSWQKSGGRLMF